MILVENLELDRRGEETPRTECICQASLKLKVCVLWCPPALERALQVVWVDSDPDAESNRVSAREPYRQERPDERPDAGDLHHHRLVGARPAHPRSLGELAVGKIEDGIRQAVADVTLVFVDFATACRALGAHAQTLFAQRPGTSLC